MTPQEPIANSQRQVDILNMDSFLQKNLKGVRNQAKKMYNKSVETGEKARSLQKEIEEVGASLI